MLDNREPATRRFLSGAAPAKDFREIHIAFTAAALEAVDKPLLLCYYFFLVSLLWKSDVCRPTLLGAPSKLQN